MPQRRNAGLSYTIQDWFFGKRKMWRSAPRQASEFPRHEILWRKEKLMPVPTEADCKSWQEQRALYEKPRRHRKRHRS